MAVIVAQAAAAGPAGAASVSATCAQLTKAELQPLLVHRITKITVKSVSGEMYFAGNQKVGENCVVADTETSNAMSIMVLGGTVGPKAFKGDIAGDKPDATVSGVGDQAIRQKADSKGSAAGTVSAIEGSTYCFVEPQEGETPGEARLEDAAGYTSDIGDPAYADMAAADGTVCNRIFHSGNTNPASALSALKKIKPKKGSGSSGGGLVNQP